MTRLVCYVAAGLLLSAAMPPALAEDLPTYKISLNGDKFSPDTLKVEAGKDFMIEFTNENASPAEIESMDLSIEKIAPPNSTIVVKVRAADKGSYTFVDEFQEDTAKGTIEAE